MKRLASIVMIFSAALCSAAEKMDKVPKTGMAPADAKLDAATAPAAAQSADAQKPPKLEEKADDERGRWHAFIGPAWRAQTRTKLKVRETSSTANNGYVRAQGNAAGTTTDWHADHPDSQIRDSGNVGTYGDRIYTLDVLDGVGNTYSKDDDRGALGFKSALSYDLLQKESFTIGARLGFAAYFNMESEKGGRGTGSRYTFDDSTEGLVGSVPYSQWENSDSRYRPVIDLAKGTTPIKGSSIAAELHHELYQLSIGPEFGWQALSRLRLFAAPSALLNIADQRLDGPECSKEKGVFRAGVGLDVGAEYQLTDRVGLFALAGYEWIDDNSIRAGNAEAEIDYSSFILSGGVTVNF